MPRAGFVIVLLSCGLACLATASANISWDSGGFNQSWQNSANWDAMPPRIPVLGDFVSIGNLPAAVDDEVELDDDASVRGLAITSGADVDTNGYSLGVAAPITVSGEGTTASELIVRPIGNIGGSPYSVGTTAMTIEADAQLTMAGGRLDILGDAGTPGVLTIDNGAILHGYGRILLLDSNDVPALFVNEGAIQVGEPEQFFLGEPPARTLSIEVPDTEELAPIYLGVENFDAVTIDRNSTLELQLPDSLFVNAGLVVLHGNSTLDVGMATLQLQTGDSIVINSGAVDVGPITLPAMPAVIRGSGAFSLFGANLFQNGSDEELVFEARFNGFGNVHNGGTIRFQAGASIGSSAAFFTTGAGQLINEDGSELNLRADANIDSPLVNHGTIVVDTFFEGNATVDSLTLTDSSTVQIDIRSVIPGQFDMLTVEGNAILDGTLEVTLNPTYMPVLGNSFEILTTTFGAISGAFDLEMVPTTNGLTLDVQYPDNQTVVLEVVEALLGDYNQDGNVNAADYTVYRNRLAGIGPDWLPNDDTPGVGTDDYIRWKMHFGETLGSGTSALDFANSTTVPEPAAILLALLTAPALILRRRRARRSA
jgi:hypothetical protein